VVSETYVVSGSGTSYVVNISQTVASTTISINRAILTLGATNASVGIGQLVSGTNVMANTHIISGSGTSWVVDIYKAVSSTTMTFSIPPNTYISAGSSSPYTISNNVYQLGTLTLLNTLNIPTSQTINFYNLSTPSSGLHCVTYGTPLYFNYKVLNPTANTLASVSLFQINNLPIGLYQLYGQLYLNNLGVVSDNFYSFNLSIGSQTQTGNEYIINSPVAFNNEPAWQTTNKGSVQLSGTYFNPTVQNIYLVCQSTINLAVVQVLTNNSFLYAVRIG
jgi:hypothetical protein